MNKGKGKLLEDEESDQEFNPEEPQDLDEESEVEESEEFDSEEDEEDEEDELQDLIEEAQEYGDGGDMVDGLRSGKYRQKFTDTSLAAIPSKAQTSSGAGSSVTHKPKGRMRSASSPAKAFIFAPAADSLPMIAPDTSPNTDYDDGSVESFSQGIDRINIEYKKALMSEFAGIRNQIISHQKLVTSSELKLMTERFKESQLDLIKTQDELNIYKRDNGKRVALVEASWTYFEKKRHIADNALIFAMWKSKYFTAKREKMVSHMAIIHNHANIMRKVMHGWRSVVGSTWKSNFEKKIKSEAEICIQEMSKKYEDKISKLNDQLTLANLKLEQSESKTELKEAEMKRALMRGVCALNMEAMSVFRDKTLVLDPSKLSVTKPGLESVSDPSFEAVIIPKDNHQTSLHSAGNIPKNVDIKFNRILVTRHQ